MTNTNEKRRASELDESEVESAFSHLDRARTYMNPFGAAGGFREKYNLRYGESGNLFQAWADTFDGESDVEERVEKGLKLLQEK